MLSDTCVIKSLPERARRHLNFYRCFVNFELISHSRLAIMNVYVPVFCQFHAEWDLLHSVYTNLSTSTYSVFVARDDE